MKFLCIVAFTLAFGVGSRAAEIAEQSFRIAGAPFEVIIPAGWIRIPEKAMSRFRQPTPGFLSNYIAGFAGPRPPPNTPMTIMLVQLLPAGMSPKTYLDSAEASYVAAKAAEPDLAREAFHIGLAGRAAINGMRGSDGRGGRTYAFPSSGGVIEFSLFCPAENAPATFAAVESCLLKLKLTAGTSFDGKWIADLKKILGPAPQRVY